MKFTSVTESYKETVSLPEYANISTSEELTVQLESGEDLEEVREFLYELVTSRVQARIDDALQRNGLRPKHLKEASYRAVYSSRLDLVLIVYNDTETEKINELFCNASWYDCMGFERGMNHEWTKIHALIFAKKRKMKLIDIFNFDTPELFENHIKNTIEEQNKSL